MNKLILLALVISGVAFGAISEPDKAALGTYKNYATNGGAENSKTGWSVSGTSSALTNLAVDTDAADRYSGNAGFTWTPANADNYLSNTAYTVVANGQLSSRNCAAKVFTKTSATGHALEAYDGSNVLSTVTIAASTGFTLTTLNFQCPASGTVQVRFNAGDTTAITFDDMSWGDAYGVNLQNISQAQIIGRIKHPIATNCAWSESTSGAWTSFGVDSDCTTPTGSNLEGSATAPSTKIPGVTFVTLPPGDYEVIAQGHFQCYEDTSNNNRCGIRLYDGTNGSFESIGGSTGGGGLTSINTAVGGALIAVFRYTTSQSNITFQLQGYFDNASGTDRVTVANESGTAASSNGLTFTVKRLPTSSEIAYNPSQVPGQWAGYHASDCNWQRSSATLGDFTGDPGCTFTEQTNTNFGTVATTSDGNNTPGLTFTPKVAGKYEACANITSFNPTNASVMSIRLTDGTTVYSEAQNNNNNVRMGANLCAHVVASSTASKTVKIQGAEADAAAANLGANTASATSVYWTINLISPQASNPQILNTVVSPSSGGTRVATAKITNAGSCAVGSQDGSWISSVNRSEAGTCAATIAASMYSVAPVCTCTCADTAADAVFCNLRAEPTTTSVSPRCYNNAGSGVDRNIYLSCTGAK